MSITVQPDNIYKHGHAHCFVVDADDENGYANTELKRVINVENLIGKNLLAEDDTEVEYRVQLNVEEPTIEELKTLKVIIDSRDGENKHTVTEIELDASLVITHTLEKEHTIQEIQVTVYPEENQNNAAKAITYGRPLAENERVNEGFDSGE